MFTQPSRLLYVRRLGRPRFPGWHSRSTKASGDPPSAWCGIKFSPKRSVPLKKPQINEASGEADVSRDDREVTSWLPSLSGTCFSAQHRAAHLQLLSLLEPFLFNLSDSRCARASACVYFGWEELWPSNLRTPINFSFFSLSPSFSLYVCSFVLARREALNFRGAPPGVVYSPKVSSSLCTL